MWNSSGSVKFMREALKKEERKYNDVQYIYPKAGHAFYPPFIFEAVTVNGGKKLPVLQANEDSWKKIVEFLLCYISLELYNMRVTGIEIGEVIVYYNYITLTFFINVGFLLTEIYIFLSLHERLYS